MSSSRARCLPALGAIGALGLIALCPTAGFGAEPPPVPSASPTPADDVRDTDQGRRAIDRARQTLESKQQWIDGLALESVTASQWSDSSLGCRRPGSQYLQVITTGYTVKFVGQDVRREVHVAGDNAVVCAGLAGIAPRANRQRVPLRQIDAMIAAARSDLAGKLGGTPESVTVVNWETVYLPARVLHCESGATAAPASSPESSSDPAVPGYKILLNHRGRTFVYYSDMKTAAACPPIERD